MESLVVLTVGGLPQSSSADKSRSVVVSGMPRRLVDDCGARLAEFLRLITVWRMARPSVSKISQPGSRSQLTSYPPLWHGGGSHEVEWALGMGAELRRCALRSRLCA